jgi:hypothetical protein
MFLALTGTVCDAPVDVVRCLRSVGDQIHSDYELQLVCVDERTRAIAQAVRGPRVEVRDPVHEGASVFENLLPLWRELADETPIVWIDGDDWLAIPHALSIVSRAHQDGAWVTYGSFLTSTGLPGFCAPSGKGARREAWRASHLKTFRAGLVKSMRDDDFRGADGRYSRFCVDLRVMFACLEMAPPGRARFIPNLLYVYNVPHSFDVNGHSEERKAERLEEIRVRSWESYATCRVSRAT